MVMIGLKKNITGKKNSSVVESRMVPNNCPTRNVRTRNTSRMSRDTRPTAFCSK